jgi:hypothetical protein
MKRSSDMTTLVANGPIHINDDDFDAVVHRDDLVLVGLAREKWRAIDSIYAAASNSHGL